jgi:hypothetical protein
VKFTLDPVNNENRNPNFQIKKKSANITSESCVSSDDGMPFQERLSKMSSLKEGGFTLNEG